MQKCSLVLVCLTLWAASCSAHICLISPPQRGSMMGINMKGADDCFLIKAQCGDRMPTSNPIMLKQGENFTVTFQKNLDHWLQSSPGFFRVSLIGDNKMHMFGDIPDRGEPSLTLFSMMVTIPMDAMSPDFNAIQVIYSPQNPKAPAAFYQCGDVMILSMK